MKASSINNPQVNFISKQSQFQNFQFISLSKKNCRFRAPTLYTTPSASSWMLPHTSPPLTFSSTSQKLTPLPLSNQTDFSTTQAIQSHLFFSSQKITIFSSSSRDILCFFSSIHPFPFARLSSSHSC